MNALYRFRCKLWNKILFRNSRHYLPRWLMNCVRARTVALYRVLTVKCRRRNGDVCSTCFVTCVPIVLCVYQICLMDARVPMVSGILLLTVYSTTWRRVLLEKLTGFQLIKKFPAFYGTWRFIPAFTSARHLSLSWASSMQSIPPHPTSWRSILMLSSHLRLGLPSGLFPSGFPTKPYIYIYIYIYICIYIYPLPCTCYMPYPFHSSRFYHPNNTGRGVTFTGNCGYRKALLISVCSLNENYLCWR